MSFFNFHFSFFIFIYNFDFITITSDLPGFQFFFFCIICHVIFHSISTYDFFYDFPNSTNKILVSNFHSNKFILYCIMCVCIFPCFLPLFYPKAVAHSLDFVVVCFILNFLGFVFRAIFNFESNEERKQ